MEDKTPHRIAANLYAFAPNARVVTDAVNLIGELSQTFTDPDGQVWTPPTAEAYYRVCKARTKYQALFGIQAVAIAEIKTTLKLLETDHTTLIEEQKNSG